MKYFIISAALFLSGFYSKCQINVLDQGIVEIGAINSHDIHMICMEGVYYLEYVNYDRFIDVPTKTFHPYNSREKIVKAIKIGDRSDFNELYGMISRGLDDPLGGLSLEVSGDYVQLIFSKIGKPHVRFEQYNGKTPPISGVTSWLTRSEIDILFGKY